jgi:uncharacterized protein DUF4145
MPIGTQANFDGAAHQCTLDRMPDECPICHIAVAPNILGAQTATADWFEYVFGCPREACRHIFIARYVNVTRPGAGSGGPYSYRLEKVMPVTPTPPALPKNVAALSPLFTKIFGQAHTAEQTGLDEIAGVGFRKALEFLVKDYAISREKAKEEEIKAMLLSQCISTFVKDERIREVTKRAAWLGNDETHYVRKWGDKDLKDLKALIHLAVNWIDMELTTQEMLRDMPQGK